jgi:hypothetical protein
MFIWVVLIFIYPNVSLFMVNHFIETEEKIEQANREVAQIAERFQREKGKLRDPFEWPFLLKGQWGGSATQRDVTHIEVGSELEIPTVKAYYETVEPKRIDTTDTAWRVRKQAYSETFVRKSITARNALRFSPTGLYYLTTAAFAGTDRTGIENFFKSTRRYRQTILNYFYDKKAFGSRQWFASDKGTVRWDDMPRFSYEPLSDLQDAGSRAFGELFQLFLLNLVLFIMTFVIFNRQEV